MKKKLIIFDLDGTLIDTLKDIEHIFNYVLIKNGFDKKSENFYRENIGNGLEHLLRKCLPDNFMGDFDSLSKSVRDRYESQLNTKTKIYDGIIPILKYIKKNNINMAVISNKLHSLAVRSVETYFNSYRMKVIGAEGGFPRKPSPDSTLHMLQNFNCSASDTLFIGDSIVDIKTAQNASIRSVGVLWGNGTEEDFIKQKSDFILESPQEIFNIL
jgi:phosphoglycolate phosphatase